MQGELDPHGADLLGNPLGGLVYSAGFAADNKTLEQVISWNKCVVEALLIHSRAHQQLHHSFVGGGQFCFKLCDRAVASPNYCEKCVDPAPAPPSSLTHRSTFDLLGCAYNAPAAYAPNEFLSCEGELQDVVGSTSPSPSLFLANLSQSTPPPDPVRSLPSCPRSH